MSTYSLNESNILDIFSCVSFSAAATIFYKKSFDARGVPVVASLFILALLLQNAETLLILQCIYITIIYFVYKSCKIREWIRTSAKLFVFLPIFLVVLDVKFDLLSLLGFDIPYSKNLKIIAVAIPQFLRKPVWLKARLQGVRSILGPIYVIYVTSYVTSITTPDGILQWTPVLAGVALLGCGMAAIVYNADNGMNWTWFDRNKRGTVVIFVFAAITSILDLEESVVQEPSTLAYLSFVIVAKFAMFASILAGVLLFRPDNSTMLNLIGNNVKYILDFLPDVIRPQIMPYRTSHAERRYYHGRLMLCSLAGCACLTIAELWNNQL